MANFRDGEKKAALVSAFEDQARRELRDFVPPCDMPRVFTVPVDEETAAAELEQFKRTHNMLPEEYYVHALMKVLFTEVLPQADEDAADLIYLPMHLPVYSVCGVDLGRSLRRSGVLDSPKPKLFAYVWDTYLRPPFERANPYCVLGQDLLDLNDFYLGCKEWLDDTWHAGVSESTIDRHPNDFGVGTYVPPYESALAPGFEAPLLYSFCGVLNYGSVLPPTHVRGDGFADAWFAMAQADLPDVFVGELADAKARYGEAAGYRDFTQNSVFTLCPAGWARWSFRLYEAIADGSIPVILSDYYELPFDGFVRWSDFSLRLPEAGLRDIDTVLRALTAERVAELQRGLARWKDAFTLTGLCRNICREVSRRVRPG